MVRIIRSLVQATMLTMIAYSKNEKKRKEKERKPKRKVYAVNVR